MKLQCIYIVAINMCTLCVIYKLKLNIILKHWDISLIYWYLCYTIHMNCIFEFLFIFRINQPIWSWTCALLLGTVFFPYFFSETTSVTENQNKFSSSTTPNKFQDTNKEIITYLYVNLWQLLLPLAPFLSVI